MTASWDPRSEADLVAAIEAGVLAETHYQDIKREIGPGPGGRKELARDLAQFAPDGGMLIIGIHEEKDARTWRLAPQPLAGLSEKIELIARANIDPGLSLTVAVIQSSADPAMGYVVVRVPASAHAPHMVDSIYYGRADTTRTRMSDAEVLRWHRGRENTDDRARRLLDQEIARDPVQPAANRQHGHFYLIAQPEISRPGLAAPLVRDDPSYIQRIVMFSADSELDPSLRQWAPTTQYASSTAIRANGLAVCSPSLRNARTFTPESDTTEGTAVDVEIAEDGGIRVFAGRMTDRGRTTNDETSWIMDGLAVAYAARTVHWARMISTTVGYNSGWLFGLAANSLRGHISVVFEKQWSDSGPQYDREDHYATTSASGLELLEQPQRVIDRLVGPFLRGLGTSSWYRDKVNYRAQNSPG